jgi:predicted DNA-binding antitoxin AbrB/MazE fold protein
MVQVSNTESACGYNGMDNAPGAQTERPGVPRPVRGCLAAQPHRPFSSLPVTIARQPPLLFGGAGGILNRMPVISSGGEVMSLTVDAIYENGVLKPLQPLPLHEHEIVRLTIESKVSWAERTAGMLQWTGDPEILRRIAEDDEFGILESP